MPKAHFEQLHIWNQKFGLPVYPWKFWKCVFFGTPCIYNNLLFQVVFLPASSSRLGRAAMLAIMKWQVMRAQWSIGNKKSTTLYYSKILYLLAWTVGLSTPPPFSVKKMTRMAQNYQRPWNLIFCGSWATICLLVSLFERTNQMCARTSQDLFFPNMCYVLALEVF